MIHLIVALLLMNPAASAVVQDHDHDEKAKEEEARKKVAAFQKEIAKAKPDDKPACIDTLAELQHPKILDELVTWLTKGTKECQTTAARHVGEYAKNQKAAEALLKAVKAHKDPEIIETLLDEAANVGYRGIAKNLAIFFRHAQIQVAKAAVDATGSLKSKDSIPPLVDLVRELEAIHDGDFGASGTGGSQPGQPPGSNT
ncbi:MAG: HEAT repeat domain-containing protein, partial [Planctomycetes bacterium]|nr:HEAT repeat domain-containing protein [Planctomycetota bacterium]